MTWHQKKIFFFASLSLSFILFHFPNIGSVTASIFLWIILSCNLSSPFLCPFISTHLRLSILRKGEERFICICIFILCPIHFGTMKISNKTFSIQKLPKSLKASELVTKVIKISKGGCLFFESKGAWIKV